MRADRCYPLPLPFTGLVGRRREVAAVRAILLGAHGRLVTLTGPPGVGKTRLALAVAAALAGRSAAAAPRGARAFRDGVCFVSLAPVTDAALVPLAIAEALGVRATAGRPVLKVVQAHVHARRLLLVLDNMEQVLPAAPALAELLAACPGLALLVTSRAPLELYGERLYPVPPLAVPHPSRAVAAAGMGRAPAVRLFVERARAASPDFALTAENAPAVAAICRGLDGLPLAIELAAARVRHLPPRALLARLEETRSEVSGAGLRLLAGGARDLPARHRSLRAAIAWSYGLLSPAERALFRRLGVFVGGCTLGAAAAVCRPGRGGEGRGDRPRAGGRVRAKEAVLDGLAGLVDKGLLWQVEGPRPGECRYGMLETVREYALERLVAAGEVPAVRARHAAYYGALAEAAAAHADRAQEEEWLARLDAEVHNLRAALQWLEATGAAEAQARLAGTMRVYWQTRGLAGEGLGWLERALAGRPRKVSPEWADALESAGTLAFADSDYDRTGEHWEMALEARRALGDRRGMARALRGLAALANRRGEYARSESLFEEALALRDPAAGGAADPELADTLFNLGVAAFQRGDHEAALARYRESLARWEAAGSRRWIAQCYDALGGVVEEQGDYQRAQTLFEAALAIRREASDRLGIAASLGALSIVARLRGDHRRAVALAEEAVALDRELANRGALAYRLYLLCLAAGAGGDLARARQAGLEALALERELGTPENVARRLEGLAGVLLDGGGPGGGPGGLGRGADSAGESDRPAGAGREWGGERDRPAGGAARTARLLGAAAALRERIAVPPRNPDGYRRVVEAVRAPLTPAAFTRAWAEGRALTPERALGEALTPQPGRLRRGAPRGASSSGPGGGAALTPREREVAALIAQGLTNRGIAARLVITPGTAAVHVGNILRKLEVTTRAQVAAWVVANDKGLSEEPLRG